MIYRNCFGCQTDKKSCARRAEIRNAVGGTGITSVMFRCGLRVPAYRPGQRVRVTVPINGDWEGEEVSFGATVIREKPFGRFLVAVDHGPSVDYEDCISPECFENKSGFLKARLGHLSASDEPDRRLCPICEAQVDFDDTCWSYDFSPYADCLRNRELLTNPTAQVHEARNG
jgi:hypothetical protein